MTANKKTKVPKLKLIAKVGKKPVYSLCCCDTCIDKFNKQFNRAKRNKG